MVMVDYANFFVVVFVLHNSERFGHCMQDSKQELARDSAVDSALDVAIDGGSQSPQTDTQSYQNRHLCILRMVAMKYPYKLTDSHENCFP